MTRGSLWDQLALRKRRVLEERARKGETTGPKDAIEIQREEESPLKKDRLCLTNSADSLTIAGVTLPYSDTLFVPSITLQIEYSKHAYPLTLRQRRVPPNMSPTQLFEQTLTTQMPVAVIDQTERQWCGQLAYESDLHIMMSGEDYLYRVRAMRLAYDDGTYTWFEASTHFHLYQHDSAEWLLAFEHILDNASLIASQQHTTRTA